MEWSLTWPIMTTLCSLWKISYIFLQKKKKLAHFPGPSLKSKKKTKRKSPKNKTKKYKPKSPWKHEKNVFIFLDDGWRLTADRFPNRSPKIKKSHPDKVSYIFTKNFLRKRFSTEGKKFLIFAFALKALFITFNHLALSFETLYHFPPPYKLMHYSKPIVEVKFLTVKQNHNLA